MIDVPVRVKDALRDGSMRKNYKIIVYEADGETVDFVIDNDQLISESVRFDERMCSDTKLKFGLCEGTRLSFQCFGVENITGRRIHISIEVEYVDDQDDVDWYEIPMGFFTVDSCSRQASTGILKISCYNKLLGDYLDMKANQYLVEEYGSTNQYVFDILETMLEGYAIRTVNKEEIVQFIANSDNYFGTDIYRYTAIDNGDQGALYQYSVTSTSTDMVFAMSARYYEFEVDLQDYIRFEFDFDFDAYEQDIVAFLQEQIAKMQTNKTASTLWNYLSKLFRRHFCIELVCADAPAYRFYGYTGYSEGDTSFYGDFSSLKNTTFHRIQRIRLHLPLYIFSIDKNNEMIVVNEIDILSGGGRYTYKENGEVKHKNYYPPLLPTGKVSSMERVLGANHFYKMLDLNDIEMLDINVASLADITLRELQSAVYETVCQYGKMDRETDLFSGIELNQSRLLPAEDLYPADDLYPTSASERSNPAMYSKLWCDEGNVHSFRYLIITYKALENGQEVEKVLQRTVNENGTDNYNCSDNWLFRNLIWTAEQIGDYADAMAAKMRDMRWFPFEMWCAGLPYIETGDEVEISINGSTYTSYVLRRNLNGIQNLQDEMSNGTLDIY